VKRVLNDAALRHENAVHGGTGGCSQRNAGLGFRPAFFDFATHAIHLSRFANGTLAPCHLLDGLPAEAVATRDAKGRVIAAKATLVSGFERNGFFYTRSAAARAARDWVPLAA
jgi:hypothetical protein